MPEPNPTEAEPGSTSNVATPNGSVNRSGGDFATPSPAVDGSHPPAEGESCSCGPSASSGAESDSTPQHAPAGARLDTHADKVTEPEDLPGPNSRQERRKDRYDLREVLWDVTSLDRISACGRRRADSDEPITLKVRTYENRDGEGDSTGAYYSNVQTCGSPWSCPVCAAKIRQRRAEEIRIIVQSHLSNGGAAYLGLYTIPHDQGDDLDSLIGAVKDGWQAIRGTGAWQTDRDRAGIVGYVRTLEVTHGPNGWHPHYHVLLLTDRVLSTEERRRLASRLHGRWADSVEESGFRRPERGLCRIEPVRDGDAVSDYLGDVVTVKDGRARSASLEMTRHDLKEGRTDGARTDEHRTPWQILRSFAETGDCDELTLWREYEEATKGERSVEPSSGLKSEHDVEEKADDELAKEEQGGTEVCWIDRMTWRKVTGTPGALAHLLNLAEHGAESLIHATLDALQRGREPPGFSESPPCD